MAEKDITNEDLKTHHIYYQDLLRNLNLYKEKLKELESVLTPSLFEDQVEIALKGLLDDIILPDINFIFTIGIGQSFGYAYENGTHYDFLQLVKDKSISDFCSTISHEVHHIGINTIHEKIDLNSISLEELFYVYFSGEGLAVKYCNNAEGVLSKSIYNEPKNKGLDSFAWKYLNDDFENTMDQFKQTISDIRNKKISSVSDLDKHMLEYWMNPYIKTHDDNSVKLKQYRLYSFGNEIWGIIHDCFGKKVVLETLEHLDTFPIVFNDALAKIGYEQYKIYSPHKARI